MTSKTKAGGNTCRDTDATRTEVRTAGYPRRTKPVVEP